MLNLDDWKRNDEAWLTERERVWQILLPFLKQKSESNDDRNSKEYMKQAKDFFDGSNISMPGDELARGSSPFWDIKVLLLPNPSPENIRCLHREFVESRTTRYSGFPVHFIFIQMYLAPFIKAGALKEEIVDNFVSALWGDSLEEALSIHHLDQTPELYSVLDNLRIALFGWALKYQDLDCDYLPYERLLELYIDLLKEVDDEIAKVLDFDMKCTIRNVKRFDQGKNADLPRRRAFVELFKKRMLEERDNLHPSFWPYIDSLAE